MHYCWALFQSCTVDQHTHIFNQFPTGGFKNYWHVNLLETLEEKNWKSADPRRRNLEPLSCSWSRSVYLSQHIVSAKWVSQTIRPFLCVARQLPGAEDQCVFVTDVGEPLRSQVSCCKAVHYDGPLMDSNDGMKCTALIQTQVSHKFSRLCLLLQRPKRLRSHRVSLRITCPRLKPSANNNGRSKWVFGKHLC